MPQEKSLEGLRNQIKALEDNMNFVPAERLHKQVLERLGQDKTSSDYRQALIDYACNLFSQKEYVSAITTLGKASKIVLNDINTMFKQDADILHLRAHAYQELNQILSARACWEQILTLYESGLVQGSRNGVLNALTTLALKTNDLDAAQKYLRRRLAHKPTTMEPMTKHDLEPLLDELVKRLLTDEEYPSARFWSLKEVQLHRRHWYQSNDAEKSHAYGKALHRLANICQKLGQIRAARVLYKAHIRVAGAHLGSKYVELTDSIANFFLLDENQNPR